MSNKKISKFESVKDGKKAHYKFHLFPANFETFNFEKLKEENDNDEYAGFLWKNSGNLKVEKGDIAYIYYTNLPDRMNRILLKCEVIDAYKKNENENCFYYEYDEEKNPNDNDSNEKIPGILLKLKTAMCVKDGREKFSEDKLREEYGINNFQGKQHLKEDFLQEKIINGKQDYYQKKLIDDLENETKKHKMISLESLINHMNTISRCSLQTSPKFKHENHTTFVKENGLNYYEQHHLIQQFNGRNNEEFPKDVINNEMNLINLCPNCHRRIHNGKKEDREKMVAELYYKIRSEHEDFDSLLSKIPEIRDGENALDWILKQYKLEKQDKDI